jgi:hypothetical protein
VADRIDYTRVLKDLETKRAHMNAEFDSAIRAIRQIMAMEGLSVQSSLFGGIVASSQTAKRYADGSMVGMAMKHLSSVGGPVPNMELAKALDEGGFPHKSKNFPNTLNSILHRRAKTVGDVRKTPRGWELVAGGGRSE